MADGKPGLDQEGNRAKALRQAAARILPDWQVFIRRPDGRGRHFTISRNRQLGLLAGVAAMALWAVTATVLLAVQPMELASKNRELDELKGSARASQQRLSAAEKMMGDMVHEIEAVRANLLALAESSGALAKDGPAAAPSDGSGQLGGTEVGEASEPVRRLEDALNRLRLSYAQAVQQTADAAGSRIDAAERAIARLGLDADRLVGNGVSHPPGQGGPFIPAAGHGMDAIDMGALAERIRHWNGMQAVMQRLPLAAPLRGGYDFNSGFGTRADPINHRSAVHEGIDLGAPVGTPVYATGEGTVAVAQPVDRYGMLVEIRHGNGIVTRYAHLSAIKVKKGQRVNRATVIGLVGNTGRSTGPHLHYEVRVADNPRDPVNFISVGRDAQETR